MNTAVKTEKDFFVEILQKQIDWDKFNRLREEYPDWATTKHVHKYLNIAEWYPVSLKHALMLDLDKTKKPLKILDIGSGAGYFLFICRNLGHNVTGLDLPPEKEHFEPMFTFYKRMFEVLNLPKRVYYEIKRLTPLPKNLFDAKFDVITSIYGLF